MSASFTTEAVRRMLAMHGDERAAAIAAVLDLLGTSCEEIASRAAAEAWSLPRGTSQRQRRIAFASYVVGHLDAAHHLALPLLGLAEG